MKMKIKSIVMIAGISMLGITANAQLASDKPAQPVSVTEAKKQIKSEITAEQQNLPSGTIAKKEEVSVAAAKAPVVTTQGDEKKAVAEPAKAATIAVVPSQEAAPATEKVKSSSEQ